MQITIFNDSPPLKPQTINFNNGLNVITGINGSGKSKLLSYIWDNLAKIDSSLLHANVLYKDINVIKNIQNTLFNTDTILNDFENNFNGNVELSDINEKKSLFWQHEYLNSWFCYFAIQKKIFNDAYTHTSLAHEVQFFNNKQDYISFLNKKIHTSNIIHISIQIHDIIRKNIISENNNKCPNDRNYIYNQINSELSSLLDNNSEKLFKYKIKNHNLSDLETNQYKIRFDNQELEKELKFIEFEELSSGEKIIFELICYKYFIASNQQNLKLLLLDEFDAHLNPVLAQNFIKVIRQSFTEQGIAVIMTTHNPSTAAYCKENELFWIEDGEVLQNEKKRTKREILEALLPGVITNIGGTKKNPYLYFIGDATKDWYIFVEGTTDIKHFEMACKKLNYGDILDKCNFLPFFGTKDKDCFHFLKAFTIKANSTKAIAIFDYDCSGMEQFKKFNDNSTSQKPNDLYKKYSDNLYCLRLITAEDTDFKLPAKYGYIPIELLYKKQLVERFFNYEEKTRHQFNDDETKSVIPGEYYVRSWNVNEPLYAIDNVWKILNKEENNIFTKDKFIEYIAQNIETIDFSGFIPTLDKIKDIIK